MTDQTEQPSDETQPPQEETERLAEEQRDALARFAKASATALQGAFQFAAQAEQSLATSLTALVDAGLTVDDIAFRVGLRREYVEQLLEGERKTLRFL